MNAPFKPTDTKNALRQRLIGLGEKSIRKSYYPELQKYLAELERFRALVDRTRDAIFLVDAESGRFVDMNQTGARQLGVYRDDLIGKAYTEVFPALVDGDLNVDNPPTSPIALGLDIERECLVRPRGGQPLPVEINVRSATLDGRNYLIIVSRDITERKIAEAEKERLENQLRQSQKMEAIGTLAGGISHDFNNLLQAIKGYTQLLLLRKPEDHPDYRKLSVIESASDRAADLVRQLLLFSRKAGIEKKAIILNHEVEQAKNLLERTIPKMIDIEIRLGSRLRPVKADPVQMEQILLNLGKNAADAMPDGGKIVIGTENVVLDEEGARKCPETTPGRYVLLTFSDTGHGMAPETVSRIFEPFYTTKEVGLGTGLGLASVYGIVQAHDGCVICESQVGLGTIFKIYLPAIEPPEVEKEDRTLQPPPKGTETILLVDDEEMIRDFAAEGLRDFGYTVLTASSGEEALEIYAHESDEIQLVLLDIGMPGMGGHKCLGEILRMNPAAKIIIVSGYSLDQRLKETMKNGAAGYIGKPYKVRDLLETARKFLDRGD